MASRRTQKRRRVLLPDFLGRCEAAECPMDAARKVFIPDDGRDHKLCHQHAMAIELQLRRNRAAAETKRREALEERLGIR